MLQTRPPKCRLTLFDNYNYGIELRKNEELFENSDVIRLNLNEIYQFYRRRGTPHCKRQRDHGSGRDTKGIPRRKSEKLR